MNTAKKKFQKRILQSIQYSNGSEEWAHEYPHVRFTHIEGMENVLIRVKKGLTIRHFKMKFEKYARLEDEAKLSLADYYLRKGLRVNIADYERIHIDIREPEFN